MRQVILYIYEIKKDLLGDPSYISFGNFQQLFLQTFVLGVLFVFVE